MRNPRYANAEGGILLDYDEDGYPSLYVTEDCPDAQLWHDAVAGKFGEVESWMPPPPPTDEEVAAQVRAERDQLLTATDWTQAADVPEETRTKWQPYRQALRDVPQQEGFSHDVVWPEKP